MNKGHIRQVMRNEWKKTCKSPISLVVMLVVPVLAVFFITYGMSYLNRMTSHYSGGVFCRSEEEEALIREVVEKYAYFSTEINGDPENRIENGKIDCAIVIGDTDIKIVYDSSITTSSQAMKDASDLAGDLCFVLEGKDVYDDMMEFFPEKEGIDMSTDEEKLDTFVEQLAGVIGMILFLLMSSNALSLAGRSVTGEKERKTFDTLVLCPASLQDILLGKTLILMLEVFLAGAVGMISAIVATAIFDKESFRLIATQVGKDLLWVPSLLMLICSATLVVTAVFMVICSLFSELKKASLFSSVGMVLISYSSLIPTFTKNPLVRYFPIVNWSPSLKAVCSHNDALIPILTGLLGSIVIFLLGILLSSKLWGRNHE